MKTVQKAADSAVKKGNRLYTDSASSYRALKGYVHEYVNHTPKEYARGEGHENRAECLFSLTLRDQGVRALASSMRKTPNIACRPARHHAYAVFSPALNFCRHYSLPQRRGHFRNEAVQLLHMPRGQKRRYAHHVHSRLL